MPRSSPRFSPLDPFAHSPCPAFTLVELTVVVLILGILAAIAAGHFMGVSDEATETMISQQLDVIQDQVEVRAAMNGGHAPLNIKPKWFRNNSLPQHPQNTFRVREIEVVNQDDKSHPNRKTLTASSAGAFWYNAANGTVRARVTWQGSIVATQQLYNQVNRSDDGTEGIEKEGSVVVTPSGGVSD